MFKKVAAEALGLSDIGKIIEESNYHKVDADDYVLNEDNEKIYFVIKSKTDEYCFTDRALIHVDGTSAVSKKRLVKRYEYYLYPVGNVYLETAGTIDLDVEIKFSLGKNVYSIDVAKNQIEQLKDLYKALIAISTEQRENSTKRSIASDGLKVATSVLEGSKIEGVKDISESFKIINEYVNNYELQIRDKYLVKNFGQFFEKYINN